jgi:hypothetical protein
MRISLSTTLSRCGNCGYGKVLSCCPNNKNYLRQRDADERRDRRLFFLNTAFQPFVLMRL